MEWKGREKKKGKGKRGTEGINVQMVIIISLCISQSAFKVKCMKRKNEEKIQRKECKGGEKREIQGRKQKGGEGKGKTSEKKEEKEGKEEENIQIVKSVRRSTVMQGSEAIGVLRVDMIGNRLQVSENRVKISLNNSRMEISAIGNIIKLGWFPKLAHSFALIGQSTKYTSNQSTDGHDVQGNFVLPAAFFFKVGQIIWIFQFVHFIQVVDIFDHVVDPHSYLRIDVFLFSFECCFHL